MTDSIFDNLPRDRQPDPHKARTASRHIGCGGIVVGDYDESCGPFLRCEECGECWMEARDERGNVPLGKQ